MTKKLLLISIPFIIGYTIGCVFPISILKPSYPDNDSLNKAEYYKFIVSIIAAFITFCAVVVALFKDDLRELWKKPTLKIIMSERSTFEEFNNTSESGSSNDHLIASKYISKVEVENTGNLASMNTEIILEKLEFKEKDTSIIQNIECSGKPINWNGTDSSIITLPVGAKKNLSIVSITAPEKFSKPDSQVSKSPSKIIIGGIESGKEQNKGTWTAQFTIYAQNHKPTSFKLEIEWNGIWKTRLTEFNSNYKIKLS